MNDCICKQPETGKDISKSSTQPCIIKMPEMEGDIQIWAGQAALMLIRMGIENNLTYTDRTKHSFKVELLSSILEELQVTPEEIIRYRETED